jgi:hypothetical protein
MLPVAVVGDNTDPETGLFGTVALAPGGLGALSAGKNTTVMASGRPVATALTPVSPHGNFTNPQMPGYNPTCGEAVLTGLHTSPTVLVGGQPIAVTAPGKQGTMASCTHYSFSEGVPTILIGGVA